MWGGFRYVTAPQAAEDEDGPETGMSDEECFAFDYWIEAGFGVLEALALLDEGLSPSLHREFVKHHPGCSPRQALQILL